jgi:hypothetical protein
LEDAIVIDLALEAVARERRVERDAFLRRRVAERLHRFPDDRTGIAVGFRQSQHAGVDARDVDEISDEPVHASGVALDPIHAEDCSLPSVDFERSLSEKNS